MAIAAIDAIVEPGHRYGCLKKRLDLRNATSVEKWSSPSQVLTWSIQHTVSLGHQAGQLEDSLGYERI